MSTYRPRQVNQLDGSRYAGLNCTAAAGAMALDRETLGKKTSTGAIIRNWTGDTVGGLRQQQVADAIERAYGVELDVRTNIPTADALALLDKGHGMMLAGASAATINTKWRASETFKGNHQWFVNERRKVTGGYEHLVFDPLADGRRTGIADSPFWMPEAIVLDFAKRLNVSATPDQNYVPLGPGRFYAVFTHDTEPHLTLRYGASAITPVIKVVKVPTGQQANVRSGPGTEYKVINRAPNGSRFRACQVKTNGQLLAGSRKWFGNIDGTRWLHVTAF